MTDIMTDEETIVAGVWAALAGPDQGVDPDRARKDAAEAKRRIAAAAEVQKRTRKST